MSRHKKQRKNKHNRETIIDLGTTITRCHEGVISVFTDPESGLMFKGASVLGASVTYGKELIVTVADISLALQLMNLNDEGLEKFINPVISLDWQDGEAFQFGADFWQAVLAKIRKEKRDVLCMCTGGHGRTGTMLSIFAGLTGACKSDPVQFVRDRYCKNAVEEPEQIEYIKKITHLEVQAKASSAGRGWGNMFSLKDWHEFYDQYKGVKSTDVKDKDGYIRCKHCDKLINTATYWDADCPWCNAPLML